jgi:hypothetical protein
MIRGFFSIHFLILLQVPDPIRKKTNNNTIATSRAVPEETGVGMLITLEK